MDGMCVILFEVTEFLSFFRREPRSRCPYSILFSSPIPRTSRLFFRDVWDAISPIEPLDEGRVPMVFPYGSLIRRGCSPYILLNSSRAPN